MFARNLRVVRGGARNFSASALRRKVEEDVSSARFHDLLQNTKGGKPLLVDFYADWCQPCKLLSPVLKKLASTPQLTGNNEVDLATIDVDKYVDLAQQYNVGGPLCLRRSSHADSCDADGDRLQERQAGERVYRRAPRGPDCRLYQGSLDGPCDVGRNL